MNRKVIIITPFFAPQSHAAVFRAYKLAKYLPRWGWKPFVVTTDINYLYNEDLTLLDALPTEVEIYRTRYVEPSLRGLRMALGGKDRTFKAMKALQDSKISNTQGGFAKTLLKHPYKILLNNFLNNPDAHWTWVWPTVKLAQELMEKEKIKIVFTTSPPFSNYSIGLALQRAGARWVADFRDPGAYNLRSFSKIDKVYLRQRTLERQAVQSADVITVVSLAFKYIFSDMYGPIKNRIEFIPTGLDESLLNFPSQPEIEGPYLVFAGEFMADYDDIFFQAMASCLKNPEIQKMKWKLLFIGREEINRPLIEPRLFKYGLSEMSLFVDHVPQQQLYQYLKFSKAALLIPGRSTYWWNLFAKLVDYIALGIPVIAVLPEISEARRVLSLAGTGIFLDGSETEIGEKLKNFLLGKIQVGQISSEVQNQFTVSSMVKSMIKIFEELSD